MKIIQAIAYGNSAFEMIDKKGPLVHPLVLVFGNRYLLERQGLYEEVRALFPMGDIVFGSTSGEIIGDRLLEQSIVLTAMAFERATFSAQSYELSDFEFDVYALGRAISGNLPTEGLKHVFVVSEGSFVNGSELVRGIEKDRPVHITLSGGLCGDDDRFERTLASLNGPPSPGTIVAIGFYGETLEITSANDSGWIPFGPERIITKSSGNILYELDGLPALDLYKKYLGSRAKELPNAALLFPLRLRKETQSSFLVRTILSIDEENNAMTLAGDMPEGGKVQLMMSNVEDIVGAAHTAAELAMKHRESPPELGLLVSCVGRKLVMDQRTEEELEEVVSVVGQKTTIAGFYSYGEIAPFVGQIGSELHNQTMTLTLISE